MSKELAFSVTLKDCRVDTFRCGGPGGQKQNKTSSGVRVVHEPSGAVGESREERSQLQNKKKAFRKMAESSKFRLWVKRQLGLDDLIKAQVEREMWPANLKVEVREGDEWVTLNG